MAVSQYLLLVNTEVDSMEGIVDCGVNLDTEASPLCAAIDKAQAQLQEDFGVLEERRRELEFLANGGNPLEFKVGQAVSISVQSTSLTDHQAEQYMISEAKGSFALATSPHADSVESSGREPNTADNLLLIDGENSNIVKERNVKRSGRRGNAVLSEQSPKIHSCRNVKESEDSSILRLGFKSQAYARRNRSRPSRDSSHAAPTDLVQVHNNTSILPSPLPDYEAPKGSSSVFNSKPAKPKDKILAKTSASDDQLDMKLDAVETFHAHSNVLKSGATEGEIEVKDDRSNQSALISAEEVGGRIITKSSDVIRKDIHVSGSSLCTAYGSTESVKGIVSTGKKNDFNVAAKIAVDLENTKRDSSDLNMGTINDQNVDSMLRMPECPDIDCKEHSEFREPISAHDNNVSCEKSRLVSIEEHFNTKTGPSPNNSSIQTKGEVELCNRRTEFQSESRPLINVENIQINGAISPKSEKIQDDGSHTINKAGIVTSTSELHNSVTNHLKLSKKAHEDAILKEARILKAKLRRAGELSISNISLEKHKKCQWDFVLEEMAWMANDFIQERIWKVTAALQVSRLIVSGGRLKFEQENTQQKQRISARILAKSVMNFWHSAEVFEASVETPNATHDSDLNKPWKVNGADTSKNQGRSNDESEKNIRIIRPAILGYAVRFLTYIKSMSTYPILAEAPTTPDRINDAAILELSSEDQHSEEILFHTVPPGAMQAYRESVESQWMHSVKTARTLYEEDCEASVCDCIADRPSDNPYEEDEGETCSYLLPGSSEGCLSSKHAHRKRKNLQQKCYSARLYEVGCDLSYEHFTESKPLNHSLMFNGKKPSSSVHVGSVPTKRVRTATRQHTVSPFSVGAGGDLQENSKTDISSADTTSFQDGHSSLHGGSHPWKNEVESTADFVRQLPFDGCEISSKYKKKKKPKHLGYKNSLSLTKSGVLIVPGKGSLYQQRLTVDSMVHHEQKDHLKKRLETQHFERNGNIGPYGQHAAKKLRPLKQLPESSEAFNPTSGSVPSPVASQMSNMSSPNKLIRIITNRDRGRKSKKMKQMAVGQFGSGTPWSTFEDQALVVLVHDMGTNWELISDAINSTLQFKRIFRKPSECKERHKHLMDRSTDDCADSAEDSGSSQPYTSTLPGIPKGSARQLFQRLQGPMEEDTLKAHFEKIILIGKKLHASRSQIVSQELKQVTTAHNSHIVALSQVCPSPLDLCDAVTSNPDVFSLQYQGTHTSALMSPNYQGSVTPVLPTSSANVLPGSPGIVVGNSLQSASSPLNCPRDAHRFGMPRTSSLPADDKQRMQQQQYNNHMYSGRNIPQSSMPVPGTLHSGVDPSVRMLSGANGMGVMSGINRGVPMPRPGYQGINSPGMFNISSSGSMLSGTGVGLTIPGNAHASALCGPGNPMFRPRDPLQIPRPVHNTEDHRQMMMEELQLQVPQGNGQSVTPFNNMGVPFSNTSVPPPIQSFPVQQHQQSHQMTQQQHMLGSPHQPHLPSTNHSSPHHPGYSMRLSKERQLQQQTPLGNPNPSSQSHHKQQQMLRNPQSGNGVQNPVMKQRQRPQKQQSQQQAKLMKGLGRGALSHASGPSSSPKNQVSEKHVMQQGQGFFSETSVSNPAMSQSSNQAKMYTRPAPETSTQVSPMPSNSDNHNQRSVYVPANHARLSPQQPPVLPSLPLAAQNQQHPENQSQQETQRVPLHQNCHMNSDGRIQSSPDQVQDSSTMVSSSAQWTPEPPYDTSNATPTAQLTTSPQENLVRKETLIPPLSQGLAPRQFSGNLLVHKSEFVEQRKQPHQQQPHH